MAELTVTLRTSLEVGRGGELSSDSPKVDVLISDSFTTDNTEGEGEGERVSSTRDCLECLCRFLGGAGTRIRTGRFLENANLFPTESEGIFDAFHLKSAHYKLLDLLLGPFLRHSRLVTTVVSSFYLLETNACAHRDLQLLCAYKQCKTCHLAFPTRQKISLTYTQ